MEELEALPSSHETLSPLEMRGLLHAVQVAVDAAMDLVAMRLKDLGHEVSDDHHNLDALVKTGVVAGPLADELRRLNGLRNAIVHKYNRFEEQTLLDGLDAIRDTLYALVETMEESD